MSETGDITQAAVNARSIVLELIYKAQVLRKKAARLEKQSDRLRAAAARDLAEYLEDIAADIKGA